MADPDPANGTEALGDDALESRIREVGTALAGSFQRVLGELPGRPDRPGHLAEVLGLNRNISGRVLTATADADPLAVAHVIPGPEPLRKLLRAAQRRGVSGALIAEAEVSIRAFETLIREIAGDRPALDAIISSLLPPARGRFELGAKHTMFRGASLLKGAYADLWLHAALVHPAAGADGHLDVAHLYGTLGLRRIRPNTVVKFTYRQFGTPEQPARTLDGKPAAEGGTELDRFCALPPAPLDRTDVDDGAVYALAGRDVGPRSAVDKLLAEVRPRAMASKPADRPRNLKSLFVSPCVPVKWLVFDMLLHEDAYAGSEPSLMLYDTSVNGMASVNDPARDADRLDLHESVTVLGRGTTRLQVDEMPRYREMVVFAAETLGWDLERFRGYRCRIQYPMHGMQVCMVMDARG
ncbi:MAG: hypothetical protein GY715_12725 [Planctomycetes bacterium]|nr:hypothetical protein [Planctomycetota bacterium]